MYSQYLDPKQYDILPVFMSWLSKHFAHFWHQHWKLGFREVADGMVVFDFLDGVAQRYTQVAHKISIKAVRGTRKIQGRAFWVLQAQNSENKSWLLHSLTHLLCHNKWYFKCFCSTGLYIPVKGRHAFAPRMKWLPSDYKLQLWL